MEHELLIAWDDIVNGTHQNGPKLAWGRMIERFETEFAEPVLCGGADEGKMRSLWVVTTGPATESWLWLWLEPDTYDFGLRFESVRFGLALQCLARLTNHSPPCQRRIAGKPGAGSDGPGSPWQLVLRLTRSLTGCVG